MGLIDSIIGVESGGNPNATNPNSSASGLGQFIDSTWLATIREARPDLAQGKSDAELLALKTNPELSRQMTEAYANQNQAILSKAGVPVTDGNTYLAHFAGPGGAVKVLQAAGLSPLLDYVVGGDSLPQRKPDPQPVKTNARLAISVGLVLWVFAFAACIIFSGALAASEKTWWLSTCGFGIALGLFAFFKVGRR